MRALITGLTGFAAGYLAEHLLAQGDDVLGTVRSAEPELSARLADVPWVAWRFDEIPGLSAAAAAEIARFRPQVIYHLAALSVPEDCGHSAIAPLAEMVNVRGPVRVLELAAALPERPRVIFSSSSYVYRLAREPLSEDSALEGRGGYGLSKLAAEQLLTNAAKTVGADVVIARAFQHTGPCQSARMMLPEWVSQVVERQTRVNSAAASLQLEVRNRETWIDLTDVRDVVRAYRLLALAGSPGEVYNIGRGIPVRTGDVLELLLRLAECQPEIIELRPGERWDPLANIRKLRAATGWQPRIALEQTVADTLAWWRAEGPQAGR